MRKHEGHILEVVAFGDGKLFKLPNDFFKAALVVNFFVKLPKVKLAFATCAVGRQNLFDVDDTQDGLAELFEFAEPLRFVRLRRVVGQQEQCQVRIFCRLESFAVVLFAAE